MGGGHWAPMVKRTNKSTMTTGAKAVAMTRSDGARESSPIIAATRVPGVDWKIGLI